MDSFFGLGLVFALILGLGLIVPAVFILVIAFVYVRQQRGVTVDINTGLSAYTVILIGIGALLIALGVGQLLTAIMAEFDEDYTYGVSSLQGDLLGGSFDPTTPGTTDNRQEENVAAGLALVVAGAAAVGLHLWLRGWLGGEGRFDRGVEGAWDTFFAVVIAVVALFLAAEMLNSTLGRAIVDNDRTAAGSTIAETIAFLGLWLVYVWRALHHVGFLAPVREGGPGGGAAI
ncbi:MAG TPA: hypothetical protein VFY90_00325 [Tepidiformaceae bacterium]|nr:hypothetical protein [Tepidiformaceae bacterium]